eukprot:IDg17329t1
MERKRCICPGDTTAFQIASMQSQCAVLSSECTRACLATEALASLTINRFFSTLNKRRARYARHLATAIFARLPASIFACLVPFVLCAPLNRTATDTANHQLSEKGRRSLACCTASTSAGHPRGPLGTNRPPLCRASLESMAAAMASGASAAPPSILHSEDMHNPETSLIARAEALKAFSRMQSAANSAKLRAPTSSGPPTRKRTLDNGSSSKGSSCFLCFGGGSSVPAPPPAQGAPTRPRREYYPDN